VGTAVVTAVVAGSVAGLVVGAALLGAAFWRHGPAALGLASLATALGVVGWIVVQQMGRDFPGGYDWPERFTEAHVPALAALAFLVAHVIAVALRTPRSQAAPAEPAPEPVEEEADEPPAGVC
jgi:TRAP-type C4-dicarboxylate transport system permease small subunit